MTTTTLNSDSRPLRLPQCSTLRGLLYDDDRVTGGSVEPKRQLGATFSRSSHASGNHLNIPLSDIMNF